MNETGVADAVDSQRFSAGAVARGITAGRNSRTFGDDSRNRSRRSSDHSKIDISWHILDRRKSLLSENHLVTPIHWKNVTVKW